MKKNEIVETKGIALVSASDDFGQYENMGMENVKANDVLIPRLTILQQMSPQINAKRAEYIKNAQIGDICDVGTGEVFQEGILFLPVYYRKDYLEWAPRASGKGLVAIHSSPSILDECQRNDKNQPLLPNGNLIAETAQWFGLNLTAQGRKCFIPFAATQLKKSRRWMTLATGERLSRSDNTTFTPPLFYRVYSLTTAEESNNQGDWSGWRIERNMSLPEIGENWRSVRDTCIAFREQLLAGQVRGEMADANDDADEQVM